MALSRISRAPWWSSLGTSIDGLAFHLSWIMAMALAAYGLQGAVRGHLEGRRFIAASSQEQLQMMRWSELGPIFGNPASPSLRCIERKLVGTSSIPVEFVRNDSALCDAATLAFVEIGRAARLEVPAPGSGLAARRESFSPVSTGGREICRIAADGSVIPAEGMTMTEFREAVPLCAGRLGEAG